MKKLFVLFFILTVAICQALPPPDQQFSFQETVLASKQDVLNETPQAVIDFNIKKAQEVAFIYPGDYSIIYNMNDRIILCHHRSVFLFKNPIMLIRQEQINRHQFNILADINIICGYTTTNNKRLLNTDDILYYRRL